MRMNNEERNQANILIVAAQNGDAAAKAALVEKHRGIIWMLARRICCAWMNDEELVQAGYLGFMQALIHYDISRETKLITYALPWILGEMRRAIRWKEALVYSLDEPLDEEHATLYDVLGGEMDIDVDRVDLRLALGRLSQEEQLLLCLRYYRDKTQKESAIILGKSQTQISRMERRALDALHAMLS